MQTTSPFDLNQSIQRWREDLGQSPAVRREDLDELEAHLHDAITQLQKRGLSLEEAFLVATKRTGTCHSLAPEYAKVNGSSIWLDRMLWMLIGAQICMMIAAVYSIFNSAAAGVANRLVGLLEINQQVYWAFVILLPPLLLSLVVLRTWRSLGEFKSKVQNTFAKLLIRPVNLALTLFVLCLFFRLFADFVLGYLIYPAFYNNGAVMGWKFLVATSVSQLPQYAACAGLILFFARKRLNLSKS